MAKRAERKKNSTRCARGGVRGLGAEKLLFLLSEVGWRLAAGVQNELGRNPTQKKKRTDAPALESCKSCGLKWTEELDQENMQIFPLAVTRPQKKKPQCR